MTEKTHKFSYTFKKNGKIVANSHEPNFKNWVTREAKKLYDGDLVAAYRFEISAQIPICVVCGEKEVEIPHLFAPSKFCSSQCREIHTKAKRVSIGNRMAEERLKKDLESKERDGNSKNI